MSTNHYHSVIKKLLYGFRNKVRVFGYNKIVTDNGVIKIKALNQQAEPKWMRNLARKDLNKLGWIFLFIGVLLHTKRLPQVKNSKLTGTIFILLLSFALITEQFGLPPLTLHYLIHVKRKRTRTSHSKKCRGK